MPIRRTVFELPTDLQLHSLKLNYTTKTINQSIFY
nr:MAG TPA: hypothetical protein [Caudoviricetes sp.]